MQKLALKFFGVLFILLSCLSSPEAVQESHLPVKNKGVLLEIDGPIGPAIYDYIRRGIEYAMETDAKLIILRLDTPGGLDLTMRDIVKDITVSPLPVVSYVSPKGSRAASAGTFILYASHIAAMAPATNIGAATPVFMGSPTPPASSDKDSEKDTPPQSSLTDKAVNDAVAYIKGLAHLHDRNAEWAEKAVREAASLQAAEALRLGVIDIIAQDIPDLLKQINGKVIKVNVQEITLNTENMIIETVEPDWRVRFLKIITNPSIAYILLLAGIYGLFFEFSSPGAILPGVIGLVSLLLALYSLQLLPINYAGLALIFTGIVFLIGELYVGSYGILGIGGVTAFIIGSVLLFDMEEVMVPWALIIGMSIFTVLVFFIAFNLIVKARKTKIVSGTEALLGSVGTVRDDFDTQGYIRVSGELWNATSSTPLKKGQKVIVVKVAGLNLKVEPIKDKGD